MKKARIIFSYERKSDAHFASFTASVIACFTGNPNFTNPSLDIPGMQAALDAFNEALAGAATRDSSKILIKKAKRAIVAALLRKWAEFAMFVANGDRAILGTSGFPLNKETPEKRVLSPIRSFTVKNGDNPGEMEISVDVSESTGFVYQHTADPITAASNWKSENCTTRKCVIKGLTAGEKRWFRVIAVGPRMQQIESEPVLKMAV